MPNLGVGSGCDPNDLGIKGGCTGVAAAGTAGAGPVPGYRMASRALSVLKRRSVARAGSHRQSVAAAIRRTDPVRR